MRSTYLLTFSLLVDHEIPALVNLCINARGKTMIPTWISQAQNPRVNTKLSHEALEVTVTQSSLPPYTTCFDVGICTSMCVYANLSPHSVITAAPSREDLHSKFSNRSGNVRLVQISPSSYSNSTLSARCAIRFRPCIDIHKGKVKQIVGSSLQDTKEGVSTLITNFESEKPPAEFAYLYKLDELTGGHVIMLSADPASQCAAIKALRVYPGGLQVGGGVNAENAVNYLDEGASHVIVTSYVFNDGKMDTERLKHLVQSIGKNRLVLDLSCRKKKGKYAVVTDRWQKFSDVFVDEETLAVLSTYADEFLVHGVDVEGKRLGIDEELVRLLGSFSPIPVTYAGGVTTMEDLETIKTAGMGRVDVTVGSALDIFGGNLPYKDVVDWHQEQTLAFK